MGRVIRREVVAVRCELRSCGVRAVVPPMALPAADLNREAQLRELAERGWGFVLTPQLRSYCPTHRQRVWSCSCRTNPDRGHLCTQHDTAAASLVWLEQVADELRPAA